MIHYTCFKKQSTVRFLNDMNYLLTSSLIADYDEEELFKKFLVTMKIFKPLFFFTILLTSGVAFSGPREDCASIIVKSLFSEENHCKAIFDDYEAIFESRLNEEKLISTLGDCGVQVDSVESATKYLNDPNTDNFFKCVIATSYLYNAHPEKISYWKKDLKPDAQAYLKEIMSAKSAQEPEVMVPTNPVQEVETQQKEKNVTELLGSLENDIKTKSAPELEALSKNFDKESRSAERVVRNINNIFGPLCSFFHQNPDLNQNPDLKKAANLMLPLFTGVINGLQKNNAPSTPVFSGQGVSLVDEEKRERCPPQKATGEDALENEKDLNGKQRKRSPKEEEEEK